MTREQIATILNTSEMVNLFGAGTTVATDLSNIVDYGKSIANMTANELKDVTQKFVAQVAKTYVDTRKMNFSDLGLFHDRMEYGGLIQRVKASGDYKNADYVDMLNLVSGNNYFDGTYYGITADNKIYQKGDEWQINYSIPMSMWRDAFTGQGDIMEIVALIESYTENSKNAKKFALAKDLICGVIKNANDGNRVINILTEYKTITGTDYTTTPDKALLDKDFLAFFALTVANLKGRMTDPNKTYNDGTVVTFSQPDEIRTYMLNPIKNSIDVYLKANTFHNEAINYGVDYGLNSWQNNGNTMLPDIDGVCSSIKYGEFTQTTNPLDTVPSSANTTTITKVIALIMDTQTAGMTDMFEKTTSQYIGNGDYTTYYNAHRTNYFVDSRNSAVIIRLA